MACGNHDEDNDDDDDDDSDDDNDADIDDGDVKVDSNFDNNDARDLRLFDHRMTSHSPKCLKP